MIKVMGDLHFGMRKSSQMFHKILMDSLNWFLETVENDDVIIILGDIFDSRSSVDFRILNDAIDFFIKLTRSCKEVFVLVGNHDLYYKENDINNVNCRFLRFDSPTKEIAQVNIIQEPTSIKIENKSFLFLPWVDNQENKDRAVELLEKKHNAVFAHLDIVGLYGEDQNNPLMFSKEEFGPNKRVISGHFHKRSKYGVVEYIGSFVNQTFNDVGDVKGYMVYKDRKFQFVEGICPKFEYITVKNPSVFLEGFEGSSDQDKAVIRKRVEGNIIKLILNEYNTENDELYKIFKEMNPLEISVTYNRVSFDDSLSGDEFTGFDANSDILEIIGEYIDKVQDKLPNGVEASDIVDLISSKHSEFKSIT